MGVGPQREDVAADFRANNEHGDDERVLKLTRISWNRSMPKNKLKLEQPVTVSLSLVLP